MTAVKGPRPRLFGTDGVRGRFGAPPLDEATVRRLGAALAEELWAEEGSTADEHGPPRVILGGDTRASTPTLVAWLESELLARDIEVSHLGTVPTPAVAMSTAHATASGRPSLGVAVSASHNPAPDNGIKLIDRHGFKWTPEREARLEARMAAAEPRGAGRDLPHPEVDRALVDGWLHGLRRSLEDAGPEGGEGGVRLDGLHVALDTGHGAASAFAEDLFRSLGARVTVRNAEPDGHNINHGCGSTHPEVIRGLVRESGADLGFTFDGDADRCLVAGAGATGEAPPELDGDAILYLWARDLARRGQLPGDAIVATSMSNLGLEVALRRHGIDLVRCDVGDRAVVETLRSRHLVLGGEQSGHIVHLGLSTTGDGLLTALQVAGVVARTGEPLHRLVAGFDRFPQLLRNVPVPAKPPLASLPTVVSEQQRIDALLGDRGRLVLRYSGTEPKVRIMLESEDRQQIEALADRLEAVLVDAFHVDTPTPAT